MQLSDVHSAWWSSRHHSIFPFSRIITTIFFEGCIFCCSGWEAEVVHEGQRWAAKTTFDKKCDLSWGNLKCSLFLSSFSPALLCLAVFLDYLFWLWLFYQFRPPVWFLRSILFNFLKEISGIYIFLTSEAMNSWLFDGEQPEDGHSLFLF